MKKILLQFLISFLVFGCNMNNYIEILKGSWYSVNKDIKSYIEIHLNDSIVVYCHGENADVIVPLNYNVLADSLLLLNDDGVKVDKFQIHIINENQVLLTNPDKELLFNRLDITIHKLDSIFTSIETLEQFTKDFFERTKERL